MKTFWRLLQFARPFGLFLPQYGLLATFSVVFGILNFTLLVPLLDVLFNTAEAPVVNSSASLFTLEGIKSAFYQYFYQILKEEGKLGALQFVCVVIVISVILSNTFRYFSVTVLNSMRTRTVLNMRKSLYEKITSLHIGYFHQRQKGDILSLFSSDVLEIENSIVGSLTVLLKELVMLIGYFVVLFFISVKLTLFTLLVFPIAGLMVSIINKRIKQYAVNSQEVLGSILTTIEETVSGLRIIKAFNAESFVNMRFEGQNKHYRFLLKKLWNRRDLASPLSEVLGVLIVVSVLLYGGSLVIASNSDLKPSEFITFILIYTQVMSPIKSLAGTATTIQRGVASGERIFQLLDGVNPISRNEEAQPFQAFEREIEFRNVSFSYGDRKVLDQVSFVLPKGKMFALVGPSGSGKSTLADLLPRFIEVGSGQILIDGRDIREMRLKDLRSLLGIVTQESILFNDTVEANIRFNTEANMAQVEDAARIAHATEFIDKLPERMETVIGDRGGKLSGGQRQRLNIARAVLRNPPVLILDEATSALDTESEKLVQEALTELMAHRTSLVIAHRLSTIQHADQILVLQEGKIVERGRHDELKASAGLYARMIEMQGFTS